MCCEQKNKDAIWQEYTLKKQTNNQLLKSIIVQVKLDKEL